jgi:hypothetical protein
LSKLSDLQRQVYDEPLHIKQFSNEYAYCYKADIQPGESCMWHRHSQDSFYMSLAGAEAINKTTTAPDGSLVVSKGDKWWSLYAGKSMVHQVRTHAREYVSGSGMALGIVTSACR